MVECPVRITAGGTSVEALALINVDSLQPESMPSLLTGWLKRSFEAAEIDAVLAVQSGQTMWFFADRFGYALRIEDQKTLSFNASQQSRLDWAVNAKPAAADRKSGCAQK